MLRHLLYSLPKAAPPSFVVFGHATLVVAMNRVDVVALHTIFVCVSVRLDGLSVGRTLDWMDGRSDGRTIGIAVRASRSLVHT